jgi:hypothetical protein
MSRDEDDRGATVVDEVETLDRERRVVPRRNGEEAVRDHPETRRAAQARAAARHLGPLRDVFCASFGSERGPDDHEQEDVRPPSIRATRRHPACPFVPPVEDVPSPAKFTIPDPE